MLNPILILLFTQALFSAGDLLARYHMTTGGFTTSNFVSSWFFAYFILRTIAMFGQLYLFTQFGLGKNIALFGAVGIILSATLGYLLLGEVVTTYQYVGIMLAISAFIVLGFVK